MPTTHASRRGLRRAALRLLCLIAFFCAAAQTASAASNCTMGLPDRTAAAPPTLDGKLTSAGEWNDAALLTSGDPCLAPLQDRPGGADQPRTVKVYSKRYTRGGQTVIGFLFEIPDVTTAGPCGDGMGKLCGLGESIVLQFDANRSRGAQIAGSGATGALANDYQIIISHKWGTTDGSDLISDLVASVFESQPSMDCGTPVWAAAAGEVFNPAWMAAQKVAGLNPGYSVEVEIPLSFLGTPTNDLGFAFAVTNNLGKDALENCPAGVCDGYGVAFPHSPQMELSNATNPYNVCYGNWVVPDEWGTLSFGLAAGDVSVSRLPDYWSNDGLLVFQCNDNASAYRYFRTQPCRARLVAKVKNTGAAQTRNLLFLWSPVGAGTPANYARVALVENVNIPAGTAGSPSFTNVSTPEWTGVPKDQMTHPCVRVYVLPGSYVPAFPRTSVLDVDDADDVLNMVAAYSLSNGQWTQKNIAGLQDETLCPDAACRIATRERAPGEAGAEMASAPAGDAWGGAFGAGGSRLAPAQPPLPVLHLRPGEAEPAPEPQGERPPVVAKPGGNILMATDEFRRFSRDNVIVQVRAFGYGRRPSGPSAYNFLENMGGVIQLVPVEMLQRLETVPFAFNVTNDRRDKTIFLVVDVFAPSGVAGVQVALDTSKRDYAPRENRVMRGLVTLPGRPQQTPGDFRRWGLSLHAGASIPHGTFNSIFNPGPNVGVDLEYRFNKRFSLEAIYTFNHFRGETFTFSGQSFPLDGTNIHNLSLNGKVYGGTSPVRPFFNFGGGVYVFDSATARGGVNVGGGLQFDLTPNVALDSMYNFHNVFGSGSSLRYSTVQGGVRFRF